MNCARVSPSWALFYSTSRGIYYRVNHTCTSRFPLYSVLRGNTGVLLDALALCMMPWQTSSGLSATIYSNGFYQTMNELFSDSEWMMRDDSRLFNNSCLSFSLINNSESVIIRLYRLPVCFTEFARSRFKDRDEEQAHLFFRFTHSWAETFFSRTSELLS